MRWLIFLFVQLLSAADYAIVFIHLGPSLPPYASVAIQQARLFNPDCPIYLVANGEAVANFSVPEVHLVPTESLAKSGSHEAFIREARERGFWRYVVERFFYLEELMSQHRLENVFHLENDVMLYANLNQMLPIFEKNYSGMIGATFDNDERCIAGMIYVSNLSPLSKFVQFAASHQETDMALLGQFRKAHHKQFIDHLPIVIPSYGKEHPLETNNGKKALNSTDYSNHFDEFLSLFDAAALGQYVGGIDPIHADHDPGFVNESCVFNPSYFKIGWERDSLGREIPILYFQNEKCPINNLHIHSKNLSAFSSLNEQINPTIEPPPPPEKASFPLSTDPIDVIIYATEKERQTLDLAIESVQMHVQNLGRIIVISPIPLTQKAEWFDPQLFPFSKETVLAELFPSDIYNRKRWAVQPRNPLNSILAHLIRLYAGQVIPQLSPNVLVLEPNVIFLNRVDLIEEGAPLFHSRGKQIKSHVALGKRLLPSYFMGEYNEISHFVLMQRPILDDLFDHLGGEPWKAICRKMDKENGFSALSLYGNFALQRTEQARLRALKWKAVFDPFSLSKYEKEGCVYVQIAPPGSKDI